MDQEDQKVVTESRPFTAGRDSGLEMTGGLCFVLSSQHCGRHCPRTAGLAE